MASGTLGLGREDSTEEGKGIFVYSQDSTVPRVLGRKVVFSGSVKEEINLQLEKSFVYKKMTFIGESLSLLVFYFYLVLSL